MIKLHSAFIYFWIEKFFLKIAIKYEVVKTLWLNMVSMIPKYRYLVWHDAFEEVFYAYCAIYCELTRAGENWLGIFAAKIAMYMI